MGAEEIAAVLEAHNDFGQTAPNHWACSCGEYGLSAGYEAAARDHRAHVAEVLAALIAARIERAEAGAERATNMAREANAVAIKHWNRAEKAETALADLRAKVEALAATWEDVGVVHLGVYPVSVTDAEDMCAAQLRDLLD